MVEEFKKFREAQVANGQKKEYSNYFFFQMLGYEVIKVEGGVVPREEINSVKVYQQDGVDLALNLAPLGLKEKE